jgi:CubicO group peptidase (beta-lactamase class C family)
MKGDVDMNCRRFIRVSLFILAYLLAVPCLFADSVDDYLREQMNARHIPGLVLVVLKGGEVIKQQSNGLANVELRVPTTKDSVFPLASITKVFTATAVYLLVQEGKLRLGDKVTQLLQELPNSWSEITTLNCLSHTSGIPDIFPGSPAAAPADWIAADSSEEALKKAELSRCCTRPGRNRSTTKRNSCC